MHTRREILVTFASGALLWGHAVSAQTQKAPILIGWINTSSREENGRYLVAFKEGLAALGWKEGVQYTIEERWADGVYAKLPSFAEELAERKPAVIVAAPLQATVSASKVAPNIPIVQAEGGDLVAVGLGASLAHPSGMVTGLTNMSGDVAEKLLELLLEISPKLQHIGILSDPGNINLPVMMNGVRRSIAKYSVDAQFTEATLPEQIEPAISRLAMHGAQALARISHTTRGCRTG